MKNRKPVFFTSDLHFFHHKVLEYDQRPFKDLDHMHEVLINNLNADIPANGICYFLGDISFGNAEKTKEILDKLPFTKILVLGNHDKGHNAMYAAGFDCVLNSATLVISGERVTMSHCPLRGVRREKGEGNWHGENRHHNFSVENYGQFHLHGHCHKSPKEKISGKQMDCGVRAWNYRPVSISQVESWIAKYKGE